MDIPSYDFTGFEPKSQVSIDDFGQASFFTAKRLLHAYQRSKNTFSIFKQISYFLLSHQFF